MPTIRGISASRSRPVVFRVIGERPRLEPLRALARKLGVADRVQIEGRLPYARVRALMTRADVRVIPQYATGAWSSTIPNKLFDYMLAGLSIVDARPTARIVRAEDAPAMSGTLPALPSRSAIKPSVAKWAAEA